MIELKGIAAVWGEDSVQYQISSQLIHTRGTWDHIGVDVVESLCPQVSPDQIRETLLWLSSEKARWFKPEFTVFDEKEIAYVLPLRNIGQALATGEWGDHPATGEPVTADEVCLYFSWLNLTPVPKSAMN